MLKLILKNKKEAIRFIIIGFLSTVINYLISISLTQWTDVLIATTVGYLFGFLVGFIFNKVWSFESIGNYRVEIFKYFAVYLFSLCVNMLLVYLAKTYIPISISVCYIGIIGITTILNFTGSKIFVFKQGSKYIEEIKTLVKISNALGIDKNLVQGGGGNTSVKVDDVMFIKASGTTLKKMTTRQGFVGLKYQTVFNFFNLDMDKLTHREIEYLMIKIFNESVIFNKKYRPSIETIMHCFMDKYCIHVHPTLINAFLCSKNGKEKLEELIEKNNIKVDYAFIEYTNPGYSLGFAIEDLKKQSKNNIIPKVVFLTNHGVLLHGNNVEELLNILNEISVNVLNCFKPLMNRIKILKTETNSNIIEIKITELFFNKTNEKYYIRKVNLPIVQYLISSRKINEYLKPIILFPDFLIYCNEHVLISNELKLLHDFENYIITYQVIPVILYIENNGLFIATKKKNTLDFVEETLESHLIIKYLNKNKDLNPLSKENISYLINMESEKYRKKV